METLQHDESPEVEEAAMEAGFSGNELEQIAEQPAEEETTETQGDQQSDEGQQEEQQDEPEAEQVEDKPLTRAELKAIEDRAAHLEAQLNKVHDRAFGKIGELQQKIEALRTRTTGLSPKAKERLADEFPELAEMLFDNDGDSTAQQSTPDLLKQSDQLAAPDIDTVREELSREFEKKLLTREHRDWEQVVVSGEFKTWLSKQPVEDQQTFVSTWDSSYVSGKLSEYKEFRKKQDEANKQQEQKKKRLESAITPKGGVSRNKPPGYDLDEEEAAMREAFGG